MTSIYVRYLLPALVIAACAVLALARRRRSRRRAAVTEHADRLVSAAPGPAPTDPAAEQAWHQLHAPELEAWLSAHEQLLDRASADGFSDVHAALESSDHAAAGQIDAIVAAHPNPLRRAELSALLAAARSTLAAVGQSDYARARHHHLVYRDYREICRRHAATASDSAES
ncbi:MAG: hypothetical protein J4F99_03695 [Acidimicrobiia bacterium]|nr:hypothetical protein [Acidimicrobiia bacterium]